MGVTLLERPDEATWREQRRQYITATDIARLANGGPAAWALVKAEKEGTAAPFRGNAYTEWGKQREGFIVSSLEFQYGVKANDRLGVLDGSIFAATPDAIGDDLLGEVKTTVKDWPVLRSAIPQNYIDQVLFAQHVFGVGRTAFGWEVNEGFTPGAIHDLLIDRDDDMGARLKMLLDTADSFTAFWADEQAVGEYDDLAAEALIAKRALDEAAAFYDEAMDKIRDRSGGADLSVKTPFGSISQFLPKARVSFDSTAFKAAHPGLYEEFSKTTLQSKPTLRFTPKNKEK